MSRPIAPSGPDTISSQATRGLGGQASQAKQSKTPRQAVGMQAAVELAGRTILQKGEEAGGRARKQGNGSAAAACCVACLLLLPPGLAG